MSRRGDVIRLGPTLLNDSLNWAGFPTNLKRPRLTLDRDGKRIFDRTGNDFDVEVPAGTRTYRLGADLDRGPLQALSTRVTCEWTFRSGTVGGDAWKPLPLSAVRFLPPLSGENAAPAGNTFVIPFEVQRQPGSAAGTVRELTVEVSYDDGATWRPASGIPPARGSRPCAPGRPTAPETRSAKPSSGRTGSRKRAGTCAGEPAIARCRTTSAGPGRCRPPR